MNNRSEYPNTGILFVNDRKKGDTDPDHKGNADITCPACGISTNYWVSAWRKIGKKSGEFLSLSFKVKENTGAARPPSGSPDDDIPFESRDSAPPTGNSARNSPTNPPRRL